MLSSRQIPARRFLIFGAHFGLHYLARGHGVPLAVLYASDIIAYLRQTNSDSIALSLLEALCLVQMRQCFVVLTCDAQPEENCKHRHGFSLIHPFFSFCFYPRDHIDFLYTEFLCVIEIPHLEIH